MRLSWALSWNIDASTHCEISIKKEWKSIRRVSGRWPQRSRKGSPMHHLVKHRGGQGFHGDHGSRIPGRPPSERERQWQPTPQLGGQPQMKPCQRPLSCRVFLPRRGSAQHLSSASAPSRDPRKRVAQHLSSSSAPFRDPRYPMRKSLGSDGWALRALFERRRRCMGTARSQLAPCCRGCRIP